MIDKFFDFIFRKEFKKSLIIRVNLLLLFGILLLLPFTPINEGYSQGTLEVKRPLVQVLALQLPAPAIYPTLGPQIPVPTLSAQGVIAIDMGSEKIIFQKGADLKLYPASTTKLMTALVALDKMQPTDIITIYRDSLPAEPIAFTKGDSFTLLSILQAMLIPSSNDAANAIADNYPGGLTAFVAAMNQKAVALSLPLTHFSNPSGLPDPTHFSSARGLARLATEVLKNPIIKKITSTQSAVVADLTGINSYPVTNINQLLGVDGIDGVKTGYTDDAGGCLIATQNSSNHKILTVVLKSGDRFGDTVKLLNYLSGRYRW